MKLILVFIFLSLINSIINKLEYDMINGISKNFSIWYSQATYAFLIEATQYQQVNVTITMDYIKSIPFNYIYINEYKNRNETQNYSVSSKKNIIPILENNILKVSFSYTIIRITSNYVGIDIQSNYTVNNASIRIDIGGGYFDVYNRVPKSITNLKIGFPYYLILNEVSDKQKINVNITMKNNKIKQFNNITLFEYSDREFNNIINNNSTIQYTTTTINNELILSFPYETKWRYTNTISLLIIPNYNIEYLNIIYVGKGGSYDFIKSESKTIKNLTSELPYYFYIECPVFQYIFVTLTLNNYNNTAKPFNYLYINEQSCRGCSNLKSTNYNYSSKKNNNQLIISFNYQAQMDSTKYICLKLLPNFNIDSIIGQINVGYILYFMNNGVSRNISELYIGGQYSFNIEAKKFQTVNMSFEIKSTSSTPLQNLIIYEFKLKNSGNYNKKSEQRISFTRNNDFAISSFPYLVINSQTNYVQITIKPNSKIEYMIIKMNVGGGEYDLKDGISNTITNFIDNNPYYFFIEAKQMKKVKINLIMNYIDTKPFRSITYYEYNYKYSTSYYEKKEIKTFKYSINNNLLNITFDNIVSNIYTNYVCIIIIPQYSNKDIIAQMNILGEIYNLNSGISKYIERIIPESPYFFFINVQQFQNVNITLITDNNSKEPLSKINIYEYKERSFSSTSSYLKYLSQSLKSMNSGHIMVSSLSYIVDKSSTNYVAFCITPNYNYNYINAEINIEGGLINLQNGVSQKLDILNAGNSYFFSLTGYFFLNINILMSYNKTNEQTFTELNIYEYCYSDRDYSSFRNKVSYKINILEKNDKIFGFLTYKPILYCDNITFEVKPDSNVYSFYIDADNSVYESKPSNFKNVISYLFIILPFAVIITFCIYYFVISQSREKDRDRRQTKNSPLLEND